MLVLMLLCAYLVGARPYSCDHIYTTGCRCWDESRPQVDCSRIGLSNIPHFRSNKTSIHTLKLSHNQITSLTQNDLNRVGTVKRLLLDHNKIEIIDDDAFDDMAWSSSLELLDLSFNSLSKIPKFGVLHISLKYIDASFNNISSLARPGQFEQVPNLRRLILEENPITILTENDHSSLQELDHIEYLSITVRKESIPMNVDVIWNLNNLKSLMFVESFFVANTPIQYTPPQLHSLAYIKCGIQDDSEWGTFFPVKSTSIRYLSFANNRLGHLNQELRKHLKRIPNVEDLDLSFNDIQRISYKQVKDLFGTLNKISKL